MEHFTNHFTAHPWITTSHLNDSTPEGEDLRNCLLNGTWRQEYPTLVHTIPKHYQCHAAAYFDNFKYKATLDHKLDLSILVNSPITFDKFYTTLMHKTGTKSPGPTGLTISVLQATPIPILRSLHKALNILWVSQVVPPSTRNGSTP